MVQANFAGWLAECPLLANTVEKLRYEAASKFPLIFSRGRLAIYHGEVFSSDGNANRVDDQRISFVMANRIAHRRGREMLWVGAVEPDAADLIVLVIEDRNVILRLQHLQPELHGKREWRRVRLALVRGIGMGITRTRRLAQLRDDLGCPGPQNGVGVVPH